MQQTTRFASRSKLVLQPWDTDFDLRKVPLEPAPKLLAGTQHALPAPPVSEVPTAPDSAKDGNPDEEDNEEDEMRRLGLDGPASQKTEGEWHTSQALKGGNVRGRGGEAEVALP